MASLQGAQLQPCPLSYCSWAPGSEASGWVLGPWLWVGSSEPPWRHVFGLCAFRLLVRIWRRSSIKPWTLRACDGLGQVGLRRVASPHPQESSGDPATPFPIHKAA